MLDIIWRQSNFPENWFSIMVFQLMQLLARTSIHCFLTTQGSWVNSGGGNVKLSYSSKMNKNNSEYAELRKGLFFFPTSYFGKRTIQVLVVFKWYAMSFQPQETILQFNKSFGMLWIYFTLSKYQLHNFPLLSLITPLSKLVFTFVLTAAALELQDSRK